MLLFENDHGILSLDEQVPCLIVDLYGTFSRDDFRELVEQAVALFREQKMRLANLQLLIDTTELEDMSLKEIQWVNSEIMTMLFLENGLKYVAFLKPVSRKGSPPIEEFLRIASHMHLFEIFQNKKDARSWLIEMNKKGYKTEAKLYEVKKGEK